MREMDEIKEKCERMEEWRIEAECVRFTLPFYSLK